MYIRYHILQNYLIPVRISTILGCLLCYLPHDDWLKLKAILDVFNDSGVSILTFLLNIIWFSNEFEAKHAVLIIEVMDNAGTLSLAFVQHPHSPHTSANWATTSQHMFWGNWGSWYVIVDARKGFCLHFVIFTLFVHTPYRRFRRCARRAGAYIT